MKSKSFLLFEMLANENHVTFPTFGQSAGGPCERACDSSSFIFDRKESFTGQLSIFKCHSHRDSLTLEFRLLMSQKLLQLYSDS
jgi:hypothetical protein